MATAKKATTKKAPARPAAKTRVKHISKPKAPAMQSFKPVAATEPFFTFRITRQTVYWSILSILVLALGIWVTNINMKVQEIYDSIDATNMQADALVLPVEAQ